MTEGYCLNGCVDGYSDSLCNKRKCIHVYKKRPSTCKFSKAAPVRDITVCDSQLQWSRAAVVKSGLTVVSVTKSVYSISYRRDNAIAVF